MVPWSAMAEGRMEGRMEGWAAVVVVVAAVVTGSQAGRQAITALGASVLQADAAGGRAFP